MKIYISKSNQANPDDLILLRDKHKEDTISEYKGGEYNMTALMDGIDEFHQVPPAQEFKGHFKIGRGTTTELDHALNNIKVPCFIFHNGISYPVVGYELHGTDWQKDWAKVKVPEE
jgi:hypothetical protein